MIWWDELHKEAKAMKRIILTSHSGFTLIEVIVVIAVVAILAAILTPQIVKNISESKVARAKNDLVVIAAAIGDFYKDTGKHPFYSNAGGNADVYLLYSAEGNAGGSVGGSANYWRSDSGWAAGNKDTLNDQLNYDVPSYSLTGDSAWKGPYLPEITADPWDTHYAINIAYMTTPNINPEDGPGNFACWALSAGPNGVWETSIDQGNISGQAGSSYYPPQLNNLNLATGDDIGMKLK
jgi:general secretion pathway protein G